MAGSTSAEEWQRVYHRARDHRGTSPINYEVEMGTLHEFRGENCVKVRTVRNHAFSEDVHTPAHTLMPVDYFWEVYGLVEDGLTYQQYLARSI
jgi:hypothetical protein